ncbi:MAG: DUF479 domain-containing protein [Xanthomonadales bacterium]|nr:DUF479 domain-containing protein [Xanthomonadales bacterium]NNL96052.1 DUF479 domain-containing protein [Xanthomonadales bacterium]
MNFLAHLHLVYDDEDLMLGAMLGDFVRGRRALWSWPPNVRKGIRIHRKIDKLTDQAPEFRRLQKQFEKPFRRYSGIIIDLAFDHELATHWEAYSTISLPEFDRQVRAMLKPHGERLPHELKQFMAYADRRGLFDTYRDEGEVLHSLAGIGKRFKRSNPLAQVDEIWAEIKPLAAEAFVTFYPSMQAQVQLLINPRSTITGS